MLDYFIELAWKLVIGLFVKIADYSFVITNTLVKPFTVMVKLKVVRIHCFVLVKFILFVCQLGGVLELMLWVK
jgi:hypothetical protein